MKAIVCFVGVLFPGFVFAQVSESMKLKLDSVKKLVPRVTNSELLAEAGSMSRYSLKTSLSYSGAPVATPFIEDQPNPDNSPGDYKVSMSGSFSGRYRIDSARAMGFGTGLRVLTPFHGAERADLSNPYVSYDWFSRLGALQYGAGLSASVATQKSYKDVGQVGSLSGSYNLKYYLGTSRFILSLEGAFSYFLYDRDIETPKNISTYYVGLYPGVDYRLGDRFTLKTSLSTSYANPKKKEPFTWEARTVTQRFGLLASLSRTIYVYPYLSFFPDQFTWDTTTLNFNTTFSVF